MDGVIVDSEPAHQENERWMFDSLNLKISEEEHKNYVGTSAMDMWTRIIALHGLDKKPGELLEMGRNRYLQILKEKGRVPASAWRDRLDRPPGEKPIQFTACLVGHQKNHPGRAG